MICPPKFYESMRNTFMSSWWMNADKASDSVNKYMWYPTVDKCTPSWSKKPSVWRSILPWMITLPLGCFKTMLFIIRLTFFRFRSIALRDWIVLSVFLQYNLGRMSVQTKREPGKLRKIYLMFALALHTIFQALVLSMLFPPRWSKIIHGNLPCNIPYWRELWRSWIIMEEWPSQSKYVSCKPRLGVPFKAAVSPACQRIESPINHMSGMLNLINVLPNAINKLFNVLLLMSHMMINGYGFNLTKNHAMQKYTINTSNYMNQWASLNREFPDF